MTTLRQLAKLQPLSYFKKYESILISNLIVSLHKANWERNRTDGDYNFTAQLINEVETKHILEEVWLLGAIIETKLKLKKNIK